MVNDWFVVRTKYRNEKTVYNQLMSLNYESFLPLKKTIRNWSDRKKKVYFPLIPMTVFVRNINIDKENIFTINGVHSILKINGQIGRVKASEIEWLRLLTEEKSELEYSEVENFSVGEEIEIIGGPLQGNFARAIEDINKFRVLVEISILNLGFTINLPKNVVRKI